MVRVKEFDPDAAVDAALGIFWEKGYANTSIQDLVDGLGINRGSLYGTFGSKHDLYLRALERYSADAAAGLADVLAAPGPLMPKLRGLFAGILERDVSDPARRGCLLINCAMETVPADAETAAAFTKAMGAMAATFEAAVRRAQDSGELSAATDAAAVAAFLLTNLQGLRVLAKGTGDRGLLLDSLDLALNAVT